MNKPWLSQYGDIPAEININQFASIAAIYEDAFTRYAQRPLAMSMEKTLTYAEVKAYSDQVGAWLQQRGLQKGDRIAVMMPNCLQYVVVVAAILRAGFCVVNVNPLYTTDELEHQLKDSGAKAIFILENFAVTLEHALPHLPEMKHIIVSKMGDFLGFKGRIVDFVLKYVKKMIPAWRIDNAIAFKQVLSESQNLNLTPVSLTHDDLAFLQYTGGTTGVAKGAMLTHGNLVANVLQVTSWCSEAFKGMSEQEQPVFLQALPLYHIFGFTAGAMYCMHIGGQVLLIANARDVHAMIGDLHKHAVHVFPAVNTLFNALLHHPEFKKIDFSNLRVALGGGMSVQRSVAEEFYQQTGKPIIEAYGLSETSPGALFNPVTATQYTGYTGLPLPSTDIAILDDDGNEVPLGQTGEICIRGPQVMAGYWQRPDETEKVMTADGYFRSGDIGVMNEQGYVKLVDRKKDMILVSGFNVYPNEVEDVAVTYPKVLEAAAVAMPHEHSGEAVKLFIVKKDDSLTAEELQNYLKEHLTGYKRPKVIEFRTELPKSNVGKILRKELRGQ